jgi:hypothetical protein
MHGGNDVDEKGKGKRPGGDYSNSMRNQILIDKGSRPVVPQQSIHQSAKMLCNRSLALKLEQNIVINMYLTV